MSDTKITFQDQDINLISKAFPKSMKLLTEYMQNIFTKGTPPEQVAPQVTAEVINGMLFYSPRFLYDFFDDNKLFPCVVVETDEENWMGYVGEAEFESRSTRTNMERVVFMEAFKQLETK